jgi:hypothetical protein
MIRWKISLLIAQLIIITILKVFYAKASIMCEFMGRIECYIEDTNHKVDNYGVVTLIIIEISVPLSFCSKEL